MPVGNPQLLTSSPVARWAVEQAPIKLQIASVMPFQGVAGGELRYAQVPALTAGADLAPCAPVPDSSSTVEQAGFGFTQLGTRYRVCHADQDRNQSPNSPMGSSYPLAIRGLMYGFFGELDSDPGGPLALRNYILIDRTVTMGGGALSFNCLSDAFHRVDANDGRPTVIMSATPALRTYENLCRNAGFEPPTRPWRWYNPASGRMEAGEVPSFNGVPWLINDRMEGKQNSAPNAQRIYFMVLGDDSGSGPTRGVTGIVPKKLQHNMFVKRIVPGAYAVSEADNNPLAADDVFVSWPVGIAVGSPAAISMIENFIVAESCASE
jgi:hypothetical protein